MQFLYKTNNIIFNKDNKIKSYKNLDPVYIAYPVLSLRVNTIEVTSPKNIIIDTILSLKDLGDDAKKIATELCLDDMLVKKIIQNFDYDDLDYRTENIQSENGYIFYDIFSKSFLRDFVTDDNYKKYSNIEIDKVDEDSVSFRENIASSKIYHAYKLKFNELNEFDFKTPQAEEILQILNYSSKKKIVNDLYYRNAGYLSQYEFGYIILQTYISKVNVNNITIDSIDRRNDINLSVNLSKILDKYKNINMIINNKIESLKSSTNSRINFNKEKTNYYSFVIDIYGTKILNKEFEDLCGSLIDFEENFYKNKKALENNYKDQVSYNKNFQVNCVDVIRKSFIQFYNNNINETILKKIQDIKEEIGKDPKRYISKYIEDIGFNVQEEYEKEFIQQIKLNTHENNKKIDNLFFKLILLQKVNNNIDQIYNLAKNQRDLILVLSILNVKKKHSKHNDYEFRMLNYEECILIHTMVRKIVSTLFNITLNNVDVEQIDNSLDGDMSSTDIELLVGMRLKGMTIQDKAIENLTKTMLEYYYKKDVEGFSQAYNLLSDILRKLIIKVIDKNCLTPGEIISKIKEEIKECKTAENLTAMINQIMQKHNLNVSVQTNINPQKIYMLENIDKMVLIPLLYLFLIIIEYYDEKIYSSKEGIERLISVVCDIDFKRKTISEGDILSEEDVNDVISLLNIKNELFSEHGEI